MKRLYARFVLWLIRPALRLQGQQDAAQYVRFDAAFMGLTPFDAAAMEAAKAAAVAEIRRQAQRGRPVDPNR